MYFLHISSVLVQNSSRDSHRHCFFFKCLSTQCLRQDLKKTKTLQKSKKTKTNSVRAIGRKVTIPAKHVNTHISLLFKWYQKQHSKAATCDHIRHSEWRFQRGLLSGALWECSNSDKGKEIHTLFFFLNTWQYTLQVNTSMHQEWTMHTMVTTRQLLFDDRKKTSNKF